MKKKPSLTLIDCDREEFEREFRRVACCGSNAEFKEAVDRLTSRAALNVVSFVEPSVVPESNAD